MKLRVILAVFLCLGVIADARKFKRRLTHTLGRYEDCFYQSVFASKTCTVGDDDCSVSCALDPYCRYVCELYQNETTAYTYIAFRPDATSTSYTLKACERRFGGDYWHPNITIGCDSFVEATVIGSTRCENLRDCARKCIKHPQCYGITEKYFHTYNDANAEPAPESVFGTVSMAFLQDKCAIDRHAEEVVDAYHTLKRDLGRLGQLLHID